MLSFIHVSYTHLDVYKRQVEAFIEIGPGKALSAFVKKTDRNIPVYSVDSIESLNKMLGALKDE